MALTPAGCPLGPIHCPLRHTTPSPLNFRPKDTSHPRPGERLATVCKHWLRGLCKKSDACEFLHEYNLRRMPECWWYAKYGYCSAGDECLYAHPKERKIECPDYKRGFCKLGLFPCPELHCFTFILTCFTILRSKLSEKARKACGMSALSHRVLSDGPRLFTRTVCSSLLTFCYLYF